MAYLIRRAFATALLCGLLTCRAQKQETPKPVPGHTVGAVFDRPVGVYDLRDYGATQADIGPAILKAGLAIQAAGAGIMELPALASGGKWTWATSAQLTWQSIGTHAVPGYVELRSAEGAIVQMEMNPSDFPALYSVDGTYQITWVVRNITFVGDPAHGDDVPRLFNFNGASTVILDGVNLYGIQGRDGLGIVDAVTQGTLSVQNGRFFGNGRINQGGTISINGGGLALNNDEFGDSIVFNGTTYSKTASHVANVFVDGLTLPAEIRNCRLATQNFQTANVWVHCANGNPCNKVSIADSFVEVAGLVFGATGPPAIRVDGPSSAVALSGGLDLTHNTFSDVGGHRDYQEPQLILTSAGAAQTRIVGNYATSSILASQFFDPTLWPAKGFKFTGGSGPVYVEEGATDTQGHILHPYLVGESPLLSQNYNGVTTLYPCHGAVACYDAAEALTIGTGQEYVGSGATYAAVTAGHHLYFSATPLGLISVPFTGAENSQGSFLSAIQAQIADNGIAAAANGGQIQLTAGLMYGASSGLILNVSPYVTDADVLASLGFTAGASFNIAARVTNLGDNSGGGVPLTGSVALLNPDSTANSKSTLQFRTSDQLSAAISTLAQPFRIAFSGKQVSAGTVYAFDGASANECSLSGLAAENTIRLNCGTSVSWPVSDTTQWHSYVCDVNGSSSTCAVDSDTPFYAQNAGSHSLTGITIGQIGAGGSSAGWDIGELLVTQDMTAQTRHNLMAYLGRNRAIPLTFSPEVVCPSGQVPASNGTSNGSCSTAGPAVPACSQYQLIEHDNAGGFQCGPAAGTNGNVVKDNGTSWVSAAITAGTGLSAVTGGLALSTPVSVANGGTSDTSLTAHDLLIGQGTSAVTFLAPGPSGNIVQSNGTDFISGGIPLVHGQGGTDVSSPGTSGNCLCSNGSNWVSEVPTVTPTTITSSVNHGTVTSVTSSYTTFATVTMTIVGSTVDCTADVEWDFGIGTAAGQNLQFGISQDSTSTPSVTRNMLLNQSADLVGAVVESYTSVAAGSHTYRVLVRDFTGSCSLCAQDVATADLKCLQH